MAYPNPKPNPTDVPVHVTKPQGAIEVRSGTIPVGNPLFATLLNQAS